MRATKPLEVLPDIIIIHKRVMRKRTISHQPLEVLYTNRYIIVITESVG